jgi:hypothetical protein
MLPSAFEYLLYVFHREWDLCCYSRVLVLTYNDKSSVQYIDDGLNTAVLIGNLQEHLRKNTNNVEYK